MNFRPYSEGYFLSGRPARSPWRELNEIVSFNAVLRKGYIELE
jgi:hypothetical protein